MELAALETSSKPTNPPISGPTMHAMLVQQAAVTELDVISAADHLIRSQCRLGSAGTPHKQRQQQGTCHLQGRAGTTQTQHMHAWVTAVRVCWCQGGCTCACQESTMSLLAVPTAPTVHDGDGLSGFPVSTCTCSSCSPTPHHTAMLQRLGAL